MIQEEAHPAGRYLQDVLEDLHELRCVLQGGQLRSHDDQDPVRPLQDSKRHLGHRHAEVDYHVAERVLEDIERALHQRRRHQLRLLQLQRARQHDHASGVVEPGGEKRVLELVLVRTLTQCQASIRHQVGDERRMVIRQAEIQQHALGAVLVADRGGQVDRDGGPAGASLDCVDGNDHRRLPLR